LRAFAGAIHKQTGGRFKMHCPSWRQGLEAGGAIHYAAAMSDEQPLPDRLSVNPKSPFHDAALLERGIGVRFNGVDKTNVEEYCVSEGWVRLAVGKTVDRRGNAMTIKYNGVVEPYYRAPE
jgi:hypothetical protein